MSLSGDDEPQGQLLAAPLEDSQGRSRIFVSEALRNGTDLRDYSQSVQEQLRDAENLAIADYVSQSGNIAALHNQIVACDHILERMEDMLLSFQSDLGSISSEILSLQQQSVQMNLKLKNRQAVKGELSQFVSDMVIPEAMITTIMDTPVSEQIFLDQLLNLEQKINFLKEQSFREARSCHDVRDVVEKLKIKAVSKIRDFQLEKINAFKKPMANYHLPQNAMLKFKFYYKFLVANNRDVAKEVRDEYVDTMSKVMFSYFKSYSGRLLKLQFDEVATREDLMGLEDTLPRSLSSSVGGALGGVFGHRASAVKSKASVWSMGQRAEAVLSSDALEAPIIVPHHHTGEARYSYEVLFRSEQYGFLENACREYVFITEFFMVAGWEAMDIFNQILGKTISVLMKNVDGVAQESYDSISLCLCLHLCTRFKALSRKKSISALDKYWDAITGIIWNRFKEVMRLNTLSVKEADPFKMKTVDQRPHYITRRYAEFTAGLLSANHLNASAESNGPSEQIARLLADLTQEVENFLLKMTSAFTGRKNQLIFLINNYDMILSVIAERSHGASRESDTFQDLLSTRSSEYAELVLQPHFGALIQFVVHAEGLLNKGDDAGLRGQASVVSQLLKNFNAGWKKALDSINGEVLSSFPNFKNGTAILQLALTAFVQYYHRFHKILSHQAFANHPDRGQLINIHQLMVEVKKYKPNF